MTTETDHPIGIPINEEYQEAAVLFARRYPMAGMAPERCLGVEGICTNPPLRHGFCSRCRQRVLSCIRAKLPVHPNRALRASYAAYVRDHPHAAPKPRKKKDAMPPRTFTDGDPGAFPTPEAVKAGKATVVESAPKLGAMWATPPEKPEPVLSKRDLLDLVHAPAPPPSTSPNLTDARATIDALRLEVATLHTLLKNPDHLRAALARIDAKAEQLAALARQRAEIDAQIAKLQENE